MSNENKAEGKQPAVVELSDWDFFMAFTNFFGVRRSVELMGLLTFWHVADLVRLLDHGKMSRLVKEASEKGIAEKSTTYKAIADVKRFAEHFEPLREGVPLSVLIDRVLRGSYVSVNSETVVQFSK